jgi:hypothetical protein
VSHQTAALLWGGSVPPSADVHVRIPHGETMKVDGVRTHIGLRVTVTRWRGQFLITSPEATFCDLAQELDLVQLVVLGDRLVRRGLMSPAGLVSVASMWPARGAALAERAAGLVRAGVDSPAESRLRMLILLAGLPEPSVPYIIRDQDTGEWLRRFELAYEELRIAIEYEGRQHRTTTRSGRRTSTGARTWTDGRGEWFKSSPPACSTTRSAPCSASTGRASTEAPRRRGRSRKSGAVTSRAGTLPDRRNHCLWRQWLRP